jgi:hypothetical protein
MQQHVVLSFFIRIIIIGWLAFQNASRLGLA